MSKLRPLEEHSRTTSRDQFQAFRSGGTDLASEVESAVAGMDDEYNGYLDIVARAAAGGNANFTPEQIREGISKMAAFAVWKLLADRENQGGNDE